MARSSLAMTVTSAPRSSSSAIALRRSIGSGEASMRGAYLPAADAWQSVVIGLVDVRWRFPDVSAASASLVPHERTALLAAVVELIEAVERITRHSSPYLRLGLRGVGTVK